MKSIRINSFPAEMGAITLLQIFNDSQNSAIRVQSLNGSVDVKFINDTIQFTYEGKFGQVVSSLVIKNNCGKNLGKKLTVLAACIYTYSTKYGGMSFTNL